MNRKKIKKLISGVMQTFIILILTFLLAYVFHIYGINSEGMKMLYLLSVLIITLQTKSFLLTVGASVIFVFTDAKLFTNPAEFHRRSFILSTVIFICIALIINVLANRLQKQMDASTKNESIHEKLYKASSGLIQIQGRENLMEYANTAMTDLAGAKTEICFNIDKNDPDTIKKWCLRNSAICGYGEVDFPESDNKYIPVRSKRKTIGVVVIDCSENEVSEVTEECILSFVSLLSIALERNELEEKRKAETAIFAREKIKGTVMKSLSHDMVPCISKIQHISDTLKNTDNIKPDELKKLDRIVKESSDLSDMIDNIIDITSR